jgi:hypothetical protein
LRESTITGLRLYSIPTDAAGVPRCGAQAVSLLLHVVVLAAIITSEPLFQEVDALQFQPQKRVNMEVRVLYLSSSTLRSPDGKGSAEPRIGQSRPEGRVGAADWTGASRGHRVFASPASGESNTTLLQTDVPVLSATSPEIQTPAIALSRVALLRMPKLAILPAYTPSEQEGKAPAVRSVLEAAGAPAIAPAWSGAKANIDILSVPSLPIPIYAAIEIPKVSTIAGYSKTAAQDGHEPAAGVSVQSATGENTRADSPHIADAIRNAAIGADERSESPRHGAQGPKERALSAAGVASVSVSNSSDATTAAAVPGAEAIRSAGTAASMRSAEMIRADTGQNDAVVMQADMSIPGSHGLLACKPVYSVYVPLAGGTEWILQYCLPNDRFAGSAAPNGPVITLEAAPEIAAPFAQRTFRPDVSFRVPVRYAFIHGYINVGGKFESLTEAGIQALDEATQVLQAISRWEFRPVMADGHSIRVEALLCIPKLEKSR